MKIFKYIEPCGRCDEGYIRYGTQNHRKCPHCDRGFVPKMRKSTTHPGIFYIPTGTSEEIKKEIEENEILQKFASNMKENVKELDNKIPEIINDNFEDLI